MLIKNGWIVTSQAQFQGDLLIEDGRIRQISKESNALDSHGGPVMDASGLLVLPGAIDAHTHMELPLPETESSDSFITGTLAALKGGTTTILDFANQRRGETLVATVERWFKKATGRVATDYGLHLSITDVTPRVLREMELVRDCYGITSFKTFLAYPAMKLALSELEQVMVRARALGGMVTLHAEVGDLIEAEVKKLLAQGKTAARYHATSHPVEAERLAVAQAIELVQRTRCPLYIVHLSTGAALAECLQAIDADPSLPLFIESCPQYLLLDESQYTKSADFNEVSKYIMSPPLRSHEDCEVLWQALLHGKIDVMATDHCPFYVQQKRLGSNDFTKIPNGAGGVEHRLELLYSEAVGQRGMDLCDFVKVVATNPAKLFGLAKQKGDLIIGADADIVLFDPNADWTISAKNQSSKSDYTIFEGVRGRGQCHTVIQQGQIKWQQGQFTRTTEELLDGRYLKR